MSILVLGSSFWAVVDGRFAGYGFCALAILWALQLERKTQQPIFVLVITTTFGLLAILLNLGVVRSSFGKIVFALLLLVGMITLGLTQRLGGGRSTG
jgi:hypothetical protein